MSRKARGKLPKSVKKALEQKHHPLEAQQAIEPFRSSNPIVQKPPEVIQKALPPASPNELLPVVRPSTSMQVFEKIGSQALVGQHPAGGNEFWITLKPQVFGGLQLRISINLEGEVSASMIAPTHAIKHTLKRHLPALRRHLQKKGHKVGKVEVIVKSSEDAEEDD